MEVRVPVAPGAAHALEGFLVGESTAVARCREAIARVAGTPRTTVLVKGERGVGKQAVARAIHERSARARGPFVAIRAADSGRPDFVADVFGAGGRLAAAEGGTLRICEVADLGADAQEALLGELQTPTVDARIVATTRRDLELEVQGGRLREDLFYRLNVLALRVPPLRERGADVPRLARLFAERCAAEQGGRSPGFTECALEALTTHDWPGNVRELRHVVEGAILRATDGPIRSADLGLAVAQAVEGDVLPLGDRSLRAVEESLIRRVLEESAGNRSLAARTLGINRTTLYNKIRAYGLIGR